MYAKLLALNCFFAILFCQALSSCTQSSLHSPGSVGIGAGDDGRGGGGGGGGDGGQGVRVLTVFYGDGVGTCEGPGALSSLAEILNRDQQQYVPPRFVVRGLLWSKV
jgi:hypothetical protein